MTTDRYDSSFLTRSYNAEAASRQARVHLLKFTILSRTEREVHRRRNRRVARARFPVHYWKPG